MYRNRIKESSHNTDNVTRGQNCSQFGNKFRNALRKPAKNGSHLPNNALDHWAKA